MRWWCVALLIAGALAGGPAAQGQVLIKQPSFVDAAGQVKPWRLVAGRWGFLTPLTAAAAQALELCPSADPAAMAGLRMAPNRLDASAAHMLRASWGVALDAVPGTVLGS